MTSSGPALNNGSMDRVPRERFLFRRIVVYQSGIKRLLDIIISATALILLSPLFIILSIFVYATMGSPILFRQKRVGKDKKVFEMMKFRSMISKKDANGELLPDRDRLTKTGDFLRKTSLDEIPELLNVLKGDMSIVGPRPLLVEYLPYYTQRENLRFQARGGLIPPDALYGSVTPTWDNQLEFEAEYVEKLSFRNDVKIVLKTFGLLFKRVESDFGQYERESLSTERERKNG